MADRPPFDVADLTWPEAIQHVIETNPVPLAEVTPAAAGPLERIVARAMSRELATRYQTAAELASDLQRFLEGRAIASADPVTAGRTFPAAGREPSDSIQWATTVKGVCALAADATGRFVAAGLASGSIQLHDAATGASIDAVHARHGTVVALTFTADGRLVAAWDDGTVAMVALPRA